MIKKCFLILCGFLFTSSLAFSQDNLYAIHAATAPTVDGVADAVWDGAPELTIPLGETYDVHDPASITDCAGCHAFNSDVTVKVKAVYTSGKIYFLTTWPDPTVSFTRGGAWTYVDGTGWQKLNSDQSEDRMSFFWPIGDITGTYNTGGCMTKCHMYYPTDTDPHVSTHAIVDDAWLISGRADIWHSKAGRGAAFLSASGSNITVDPATHQVTAGTFSMTGYADDKHADVWADDTVNGEDGGRYGDSGTSAYSHNRISDKSRPKYMETAPTDFADAMVLTQAEIDAGECVGDAATGVSDADAATYWPVYSAFNAVIPERILRTPDGSRADIGFGAVWSDGVWTAEFARDLDTGNDDDVQFDDLSKEYLFNVAAFENSRHGYEHRTSETYSLRFLSVVNVDESIVKTPNSFNLLQNYPNPFNPVTTIKYEISRASYVSLKIYTVLGREVRTLVNNKESAGYKSVVWNGLDNNGVPVSTGVYIYRIKAGEFTAIKRMVLVK